jgi:ABC-2 type transport system permease protein
LPSRSSRFLWLLDKEWRELLVSKAWWVMLAVMGPLVGMSFIGSVRTYSEVSGLNGTSAGVGEALSPLTGVWAPTFSACELAAVFLLPFVTIRLMAGDRQSGALKLELQQGMSAFSRIAAKALVLMAGWLVAMLPPFSAIVLWASYGGNIHTPELLTLTAGHLLNAGITIGLAGVMASLTGHPSTAAILTLAATVGTWIVSFFGAIQGGWWERAAGYTPAAMVAEFQHGLLRLDTSLIALVLSAAGLAIAAIWSQLGLPVRRRTSQALAAAVLAAAAVAACTSIHLSWDLSESRSNSFSKADEQALRSIHAPLSIEAHLAPEDPRRIDLEHHALSKLRRILPNLQVRYVSGTSIGLFEQTRPGYGEIWFDLGGRKTMTRVTTAEGVLEAIYSLSGTPPPAENDEAIFRGHPLAVPPKGAGTVFYILWPGLFLAMGIMVQRRFQ